MNKLSVIKRAALVAVVGMLASQAMAGGNVNVDIHIGNEAPPPPAPTVVVVREREPVVYETYVVGYRRDLYDADLRLRVARADEWRAHEELDVARRREGEIAVELDEREATIGELRHRVGRGDANVAEIHERVAGTADLCADLHKKLGALHHRIAAAREDYDAAKTLGDRDGMADAAERIKSNEARAGAVSIELRDSESRLGRLREEEAAANAFAADHARLREAEARAGALHHDLELAHEAVFNTQARLAAASDAVCLAVRDRDEAMWLLHRDEIIAGRCDPAVCGFSIDLSLWGGHMPRDPEVIHAHCVHEVGYWRTNPVLIEERVVFVDRCPEVGHIRTFQRTREPERIQVVEKIEVTVKVEDRRRVAEKVVVERERYHAETVERKTAVVEHRAPRPVYIEKPVVVNNTTIINNGASQKEMAGLHREVKEANKNAAEAKQAEAADAARIRKDEAKIAEQQKELASEHRELKKTEAKVAEVKTAEAKDRRAVEKTNEKVADQQKELAAEHRELKKTEEKVAETKGADKPAAEPRKGADTKADVTAETTSRRSRGAAAAPPADEPATSSRRSRGAETPAAPATEEPSSRRSRGAAAAAPAPADDPAAGSRRSRGTAAPAPAPADDPAAGSRRRRADDTAPTTDARSTRGARDGVTRDRDGRVSTDSVKE